MRLIDPDSPPESGAARGAVLPRLGCAKAAGRLLFLAMAMVGMAKAETPVGGCDWTALPVRDASEQNLIIGVRGECVTIEIRTVGSASVHQMSAVFVCENLPTPRESRCTIPAATIARPAEVRIHGENPAYDLVGWFAEPVQGPPGEPSPPLPVPGEGGALLRWRSPQPPAVRYFEFEYAAVDTTPTGTTAPVWQALDQPDAWVYCVSYTPPTGGPPIFHCLRDVPYLGNRYRVRACNWSGPQGTSRCGAWAEEAFLTCTALPRNSSSCPCIYPSADGCVYP